GGLGVAGAGVPSVPMGRDEIDPQVSRAVRVDLPHEVLDPRQARRVTLGRRAADADGRGGERGPEGNRGCHGQVGLASVVRLISAANSLVTSPFNVAYPAPHAHIGKANTR